MSAESVTEARKRAAIWIAYGRAQRQAQRDRVALALGALFYAVVFTALIVLGHVLIGLT